MCACNTSISLFHFQTREHQHTDLNSYNSTEKELIWTLVRLKCWCKYPTTITL